ncbi:uncharacterized protein LOC135110329 [Scylla paramamosain]|uniref:uncharacterized protein LOC135110329 n=1 Tax=Scylla paramamosain TaxID=85552 RepID=UPI0030832662
MAFSLWVSAAPGCCKDAHTPTLQQWLCSVTVLRYKGVVANSRPGAAQVVGKDHGCTRKQPLYSSPSTGLPHLQATQAWFITTCVDKFFSGGNDRTSNGFRVIRSENKMERN